MSEWNCEVCKKPGHYSYSDGLGGWHSRCDDHDEREFFQENRALRAKLQAAQARIVELEEENKDVKRSLDLIVVTTEEQRATPLGAKINELIIERGDLREKLAAQQALLEGAEQSISELRTFVHGNYCISDDVKKGCSCGDWLDLLKDLRAQGAAKAEGT